MDQRKIILFGKSAFCITIPQAWAKKNKLRKGDMIGVQETLRNSLEIIPTSNSTDVTGSIDIDISAKSSAEISTILLATYLNGYTTITLRGNNTGKVSSIRKDVHDLIAAEIMELNADKISIHILWDIDSINLRSIINRIDNIMRVIFAETTLILDSENTIDDIIEKGHEVKRQVLLARRAITYALNNSVTAQKFNLLPLELYYLSYIVYFFGMIGNHAVEIAIIIHDAKKSKEFNPAICDELRPLLQQMAVHFENVTKGYSSSSKREHFSIGQYQKFEEAIAAVSSKHHDSRLPVIIEYMKMVLAKIKETELVIVNRETSPR